MKSILSVIIVLSLAHMSDAQHHVIQGRGKYYDQKGRQHDGYLFYHYGPQKLKFRVNFSDKKNLKLKPWKVTGFVIEEDSFAILEDFYIEQLDGIKEHRIMDYVQVLDTGQVLLYKHMTIASAVAPSHFYPDANEYIFKGGKKIENYLIKFKEATSLLVPKKLNEKKFKEQMLRFFEGFPEFQAKVQEKGFYWTELPEVIREFNIRYGKS